MSNQPSVVDSTPVTSHSSSRTRTTDPGATSRIPRTALLTPSFLTTDMLVTVLQTTAASDVLSVSAAFTESRSELAHVRVGYHPARPLEVVSVLRLRVEEDDHACVWPSEGNWNAVRDLDADLRHGHAACSGEVKEELLFFRGLRLSHGGCPLLGDLRDVGVRGQGGLSQSLSKQPGGLPSTQLIVEALVAEGPEAGVAARLLTTLAGSHDLERPRQDVSQVLSDPQDVARTTRDRVEERQRRRAVFGAKECAVDVVAGDVETSGGSLEDRVEH